MILLLLYYIYCSLGITIMRESRDTQALLMIDHLFIPIWDNFDSPNLKIPQWCQHGISLYVRTCRWVKSIKKIATIHESHLPVHPFVCQLDYQLYGNHWQQKSEISQVYNKISHACSLYSKNIYIILLKSIHTKL